MGSFDLKLIENGAVLPLNLSNHMFIELSTSEPLFTMKKQTKKYYITV